MLPACLEEKVIEYVDTSLGDTRLDKCSHQINQSFYVKTLSRKLRKFIACRDTRQRIKHPNPNGACMMPERSHTPFEPGSLFAVVLHGNSRTARRGVKYILVCYDVFSKYIKLYSLKAATT